MQCRVKNTIPRVCVWPRGPGGGGRRLAEERWLRDIFGQNWVASYHKKAVTIMHDIKRSPGRMLLSSLPSDPKDGARLETTSVSAAIERLNVFLNGIHKGEIRELRGTWRWKNRPLPTGKAWYHSQIAEGGEDTPL